MVISLRVVPNWVMSGLLVITTCLSPAVSDEPPTGLPATNGAAVFNGKNLDGWKAIIGGKEGAAGETFTVKNGTLEITGRPSGYVVTEKSFRNYTIQYDWKFVRPTDFVHDATFLGNSGLLVHIQGLPNNRPWPACLEIQGANRNHGMLINVGGAKGGPYKFDPAALESTRKPVGEWNTTQAVIDEGRVTVKVNGVLVASGVSELHEGPIGFQSEGAELRVRNILVKEIK